MYILKVLTLLVVKVIVMACRVLIHLMVPPLRIVVIEAVMKDITLT